MQYIENEKATGITIPAKDMVNLMRSVRSKVQNLDEFVGIQTYFANGSVASR